MKISLRNLIVLALGALLLASCSISNQAATSTPTYIPLPTHSVVPNTTPIGVATAVVVANTNQQRYYSGMSGFQATQIANCDVPTRTVSGLFINYESVQLITIDQPTLYFDTRGAPTYIPLNTVVILRDGDLKIYEAHCDAIIKDRSTGTLTGSRQGIEIYSQPSPTSTPVR